jgi:hypothetical protein
MKTVPFPARALHAACAAFVILTALTASAPAALVDEDFSSDPIAGGRATVIGVNRYSYNAQSQTLTAAYNANLATSGLHWSLGTSLNENTDFSISVVFTIQSAGEVGGTGQIAFGLLNTVTTGPDRAGGSTEGGSAYDFVGLDYFPGSFESVGPTVINTEDTQQGGFFSNIRFDFGAETSLQDTGETPLNRDVPLTALLNYSAAARTFILRLTGDNTPVNLIGAGGATGGPDGDVDTIRVALSPGDAFTVNAFGITLWEDTFRDPDGGLQANVAFKQITVVPEPSAAALLLAPLLACAVSRRRTR